MDVADIEIEVEPVTTLNLILKNPSLLDKLIMYNGKVLTNVLIVEQMQFPQNEFCEALQILLARCIDDMTGLKRTTHLPACLNDYIRYQNPKPLPQKFM